MHEKALLDDAGARRASSIATSRRYTLVADSMNVLATALDLQGKVEAADSAYRQVLAIRQQLHWRETSGCSASTIGI